MNSFCLFTTPSVEQKCQNAKLGVCINTRLHLRMCPGMTTENKACFIEVIHSNVDLYMRMPGQARISCRFYDSIVVACEFYFNAISLVSTHRCQRAKCAVCDFIQVLLAQPSDVHESSVEILEFAFRYHPGSCRQ